MAATGAPQSDEWLGVLSLSAVGFCQAFLSPSIFERPGTARAVLATFLSLAESSSS